MPEETVDPKTGEVEFSMPMAQLIFGRLDALERDAAAKAKKEPVLIIRSDECDQLFAALAQAQVELTNAVVDSENEAFKNQKTGRVSKYASLGAYLDAGRATVAKYGVAVVQLPSVVSWGDGYGVRIISVLGHKSGQWMASSLTLPSEHNIHKIGSAITYGRRYAFGAMIGIAPEEDDDGNSAAGKVTPSDGGGSYVKKEPAKPEQPKLKLTPEQERMAQVFKP